MNENKFCFIILTFNEEIHISRLMHSIIELNAPTFILDSGSTDNTIKIAEEYNCIVKTNPFENHPKQWDYALRHFVIETPWVICLDADQIVSSELFNTLNDFRNMNLDEDIDGIYFNRKNYFKGRWINHGGYFPKYMLKMFRAGKGFSDLNENMDHRFLVSGKSVVWKDAYIIEDNLKENDIGFWIDKHNRYSDLVAREEIERRLNLREQRLKPKLFGNPDERIAFYKKLWWKLPLFIRPFLYFFYRYFLRLGFLDGKEGLIFHLLQGFWFRFIVDVKIYELLKLKKEK